MWLLSAIKISFKNLAASKLRSFLTMLGIVIGVASVIVIFSIGQSAQEMILGQIKSVGTNLIAVLPGASDEKGPPAAAFGISVTTLTYDDLEVLRDGRSVPEVEAGAGYVQGTVRVSSKKNNLGKPLIGTTASYLEVESAEIEKGRFFTQEEERNLSRVAVLGSSAAEDLFGSEDPLNQKIEIKDQRFMVIGVLKERGATAFGISNQDDGVVIPLFTAQKNILGVDHLGFVRLKVKDEKLISLGKAHVMMTMRELHKIKDPQNDDFSVRDMASALETLKNVTDALRYFLLSIGIVSLAVGGVGIMNIMLISVNQRIREVGTRKAVGAKNSDIMAQFLVESAAVSFTGGVVGIVLGIVASFLVSLIVQYLGYDWPFFISFYSILVAAMVSIGIGVIFGLYPARKAAKISPMEALRYE